MKTDRIKSRQNFGWNPSLHIKMTQKALEKIPALNEFQKHIVQGASTPKPFFPFPNLFGVSSCYYGEKLSREGSQIQHGFDIYYNNLMDSVIEWSFGYETTAMKKLGAALRVLQDAADPAHTQRGYNSILNNGRFKKYENISLGLDVDKIMQGAPQGAHADNFYDLFGDVYKKSSNQLNPLDKKNIRIMDVLTEQNVTNACCATMAFLKRLANLHVMSDSHIIKAVETESYVSKFLSGLEKQQL